MLTNRVLREILIINATDIKHIYRLEDYDYERLGSRINELKYECLY